jgi:hypothetical protein
MPGARFSTPKSGKIELKGAIIRRNKLLRIWSGTSKDYIIADLEICSWKI